MSVPPFEIISFYDEPLEERIKVYFLSEGIRSEYYFYNELLINKDTGFSIDTKYNPKELKKTDLEAGITDPITLTKAAIAWCNNPANKFDTNKDKMIISFDLDRVDDDGIKELIKLKKDYIVYAFTNPKFEVVQLLSVIDDLTELEKEYTSVKFSNNILENKFSSITHASSKKKAGGKEAAKNYNNLILHRKYDECDLSHAKKYFCTNVINILISLQNGKL